MKFKIVVFSVAVIARVFSIEIIFVKTATIVAFFFSNASRAVSKSARRCVSIVARRAASKSARRCVSIVARRAASKSARR